MKNFLNRLSHSPAVRFVLTIGIVDLFGDMAYAGGASMNGLFLGSLGASAAIVSAISGGSEFLNYLLRGVSGYVADKIGKHWLLVFAGYIFNLFAVPAIALAGHWQIAAGLIVLQGLGRGTRKPITLAMLSYAAGQRGKGWVYGVHGALDLAGRTLGPVIVTIVLATAGSLRTGYAFLLAPALMAMLFITIARVEFPVPAKLEQRQAAATSGFTRAYWLYLTAGACFAAGLMNFELISFDLSRRGAAAWHIPLFLTLASGISSVGSFSLGKLYDRTGMPVLFGAILLSAVFSPFLFLLPFRFVLIGMALWGIGQVTQDMLLNAVVAGVLPKGRRDFAFGLFHAGYGLGWLLGAVIAGLLYEQSRVALVLFSSGVQILSLSLFLIARRTL